MSSLRYTDQFGSLKILVWASLTRASSSNGKVSEKGFLEKVVEVYKNKREGMLEPVSALLFQFMDA